MLAPSRKYMPARQPQHAPAPRVGVKAPAEQAMHADAPVAAVQYEPAAQEVHIKEVVELVAVEKAPKLQLVQPEDPVRLL